jgi:pyruvate-ferredoxin/flavodoxin oxidoreductase
MIPNMYKIAGEAISTVFHIAARAVATHALSIFGDHQDVMATRQTGWAILSSNNVQEVMDFALIAHAATLKARVPFLHFFDGFRTSHEVAKIEELSYDVMRAMIPEEKVREHRARGLNPEHPEIRGTSQNPDVYFQGREATNKLYEAVPGIVEETIQQFAELTGRSYKLFDYAGAPDADRIVILMGSAADTAEETAQYLAKQGEKVGVVKVHLFRPFSVRHFVAAIPATVKSIAVLDRTKEPGAIGEPLYEDVRTAIGEAMSNGTAPFKGWPTVVGGRYGLGSYEFTPAMVKAVFDNLKAAEPKNHFTVGINDDVSFTSLPFDEHFHLPGDGIVQCLFYGLGSDGTVGANKNSIKIIGDDTDNSAQGYFVTIPRKPAPTPSAISLRPEADRKSYLSERPTSSHATSSLPREIEMLSNLKDGGTFLLNSPSPRRSLGQPADRSAKQIIDKKTQILCHRRVRHRRQVGHGLGSTPSCRPPSSRFRCLPEKRL